MYIVPEVIVVIRRSVIHALSDFVVTIPSIFVYCESLNADKLPFVQYEYSAIDAQPPRNRTTDIDDENYLLIQPESGEKGWPCDPSEWYELASGRFPIVDLGSDLIVRARRKMMPLYFWVWSPGARRRQNPFDAAGRCLVRDNL